MQIAPEILILLLAFVAGTVFLARTNSERHFLLFIIRTERFLKVIDGLARISPAFWKLVADFSIVFSFSGMGAYYLSRQGRENHNLDVIISLFGLLGILVWAKTPYLAALMLAGLMLLVYGLSRIKNAKADFISVSFIISAILMPAFPWYLAVGEGVFGLLAIVVGSLVENAFAIGSGESDLPGVSPIIPWIEGGNWGFIIPGLGIFIPLLEGVLALIILLFVHEFAHGILARAHDLKLRSTGLLTVGPVPVGAFVEPDEEEFKTRESIAKMRVLSMGSFANLMLAIFSLLAFALLLSPGGGWIVMSSGSAQIENGSVIDSIGNVSFSEINHVSSALEAEMFSNRFYSVKNDSFQNQSLIDVTTGEGSFELSPQELSTLKIRYKPEYKLDLRFFGVDWASFLSGLLFWLYFFNFNVGLVNLLPIVPFDGGKMVLEFLDTFRLDEKLIAKIAYAILLAGLLILLINAYPLFLMVLELF